MTTLLDRARHAAHYGKEMLLPARDVVALLETAQELRELHTEILGRHVDEDGTCPHCTRQLGHPVPAPCPTRQHLPEGHTPTAPAPASPPRRVSSPYPGGPRPTPDAIPVGRGTRWANPYTVTWENLAGGIYVVRGPGDADVLHAGPSLTQAAAAAVHAYTRHLVDHGPALEEIRAALTGRDLACSCPAERPCHADVLLTHANPTPTPRTLRQQAHHDVPIPARSSR